MFNISAVQLTCKYDQIHITPRVEEKQSKKIKIKLHIDQTYKKSDNYIITHRFGKLQIDSKLGGVSNMGSEAK